MRPGAREILARELADSGCRALLVVAGSSRDPDLAAFVGPVHLGSSFLILPAGGPAGGSPRLGYLTPMERGEAAAAGLALLDPEALEMPRWLEELPEAHRQLAAALGRGLALAGLTPGRLALAGHGPAGELRAVCGLLETEGWSFHPGNDLARRLRKAKTTGELKAIRRAAAGTGAAFRHLAQLLAAAVEHDRQLWLEGERLTVARLRTAAGRALAEAGLEQPHGNIVAPGEEGAMPHSTGTPERVLRPGESLVVDLFPHGELYADCTRTFCVGRPSDALLAAHDAVLSALGEAHAAAVPGVRGWSLQEGACGLLAARGYPTPITDPGTTTGYVHGLGHGVGFELHEYPSFRKQAGAEGLLAEGDVFTLEPGLYQPDPGRPGGGWGVRIEDLVHLGPAGAENLTPLPYALDPREWAA